jgi:peptidyl-prolyl cis-trans isomerase C
MIGARPRAAPEQETNMRIIVTAGILAGAMLASPLAAQDEPAAPETGAAPQPGAAAETATTEYDAETVLATVNGTDITLGHVIAMRNRLPAQYQQLPDAVLMTGLVDQLVDQQLLAASVDGEDPIAVRLHLENERRGALAGQAAQAAVEDAVSEEEVQAAYDTFLSEFQPQTEWNASHILVDS